jgi:hypothetical protein
MLWVDMAGRLVGPPAQPRGVRDQVQLATVFAFLAVGGVVLFAGQLVYGALDRWRLAAWEADWRTIEPPWTGRR